MSIWIRRKKKDVQRVTTTRKEEGRQRKPIGHARFSYIATVTNRPRQTLWKKDTQVYYNTFKKIDQILSLLKDPLSILRNRDKHKLKYECQKIHIAQTGHDQHQQHAQLNQTERSAVGEQGKWST